MNQMKKYFQVLCVTFYFATFIACDKNENTDPSTEKYFPQVKTIIQNNCLSCHSSTGTWQGRPVAFDNDAAIAEQYMAIKLLLQIQFLL